MELLQHDRSWDARHGRSALALRLLSFDAGEPPHAEDAFLADFVRFVRSQDGDASRTWLAIEVGRAALDLIDDLEGSWQTLPIETWLDGLSRALVSSTLIAEREPARGLSRAARVAGLARGFIEWLVMRGRLSLHGQRTLARRIATWRGTGACDAH
jgi:hypothetical protein